MITVLEVLTEIMTETGFIFIACAALFAAYIRIEILQEQIRRDEQEGEHNGNN